MKRIASSIVMALIAFVPLASGDSILNVNITYVTAFMGPNDGSGDNVCLTLIGPGTNITATAGMACFDWCSGPITEPSSYPSEVFLSNFITATVAGTTYDASSEISLCCIFSFFGYLNPSASGLVGQGDTYRQVNLTLPGAGNWNFNFDYYPASGGYPAYYLFARGSFTAGTPPTAIPEPGTLALLATGLAGLAGAVRRRRLITSEGARVQQNLPEQTRCGCSLSTKNLAH
jgi:hypothetical protein